MFVCVCRKCLDNIINTSLGIKKKKFNWNWNEFIHSNFERWHLKQNNIVDLTFKAIFHFVEFWIIFIYFIFFSNKKEKKENLSLYVKRKKVFWFLTAGRNSKRRKNGEHNGRRRRLLAFSYFIWRLAFEKEKKKKKSKIHVRCLFSSRVTLKILYIEKRLNK